MDIIVERGYGLDVHKKTIVACIMGVGIKKEIRTYKTFTNDLLDLKGWLKENGITHVAMESTGIYWKPVFNILEDSFEVILVNARHIKNVPGRKTDVCDSEWICKLLRNGLVRGSFVPPADIRELRDLTRTKRKLRNTISAEKGRIQKVLEDANIKLSSVVSDTFGISGSEIIDGLVGGKLDIDNISELLRGKLKKKKEEIKEALVGNVTEHHKFMIQSSLEHIKGVEKIIADINGQIAKKIEKYREEYELLQTIPGVKAEAAASIIAEIGVDMDKFATAGHLSSWAGMSSGNNETAGKKKDCRTTHGNKNLEVTLTESGWAAARTKETHLSGKYHWLAGRRGKKRALIAVGHKILIICYYILKYKIGYKELGINYLDSRKKAKIIKFYTNRLNKLGYNVVLKEAA